MRRRRYADDQHFGFEDDAGAPCDLGLDMVHQALDVGCVRPGVVDDEIRVLGRDLAAAER